MVCRLASFARAKQLEENNDNACAFDPTNSSNASYALGNRIFRREADF